LQGIPLEQLPGLVSNPFHPPAPGSDDPHHGVDLAIRLPNSEVAVSGNPVQAALAGSVAAVIRDRFPYGNALLVETPLEEAPPALDLSRRSLYVMYAHMRDPVDLNPGDTVACGQAIGAVGSTGNALNPHLHLEMRVGPAGMRFSSMAHYDNSATSEEMSSYCLWRISGLFQLVDPLRLIALPQGN
jgi:murein DD-endopeptidase MepM/ murein hydrolase activator NlpD